jgi:hypothetical protein
MNMSHLPKIVAASIVWLALANMLCSRNVMSGKGTDTGESTARSTITGTFTSQTPFTSLVTVQLRPGTTIDTIDSQGFFKLADVPEGTYVLTFMAGPAILRNVFFQNFGRDTSLTLHIDSGGPQILLDDFEDGDSLGLLDIWTKGNYWQSWFNGDGQHAIVPSSVPGWMVQDSGNGVMHVSYSVDVKPYNNANCGLNLHNDSLNRDADLSSMTFLQFRAKGSGKIRIRMISTIFVEQYGSTIDPFKEITLTDSWQRYSFNIDDSWLPNTSVVTDNGLHWQELFTTIRSLAFMAEDTADFWLDDVGINGADPFGL